MATVVVPFRGSDPKRRLGAGRGARPRPARRGDARRRARRGERGRARLRRRAGRRRRCPTACSTSPIRAAARAPPCAPRSTRPSPPARPRRTSSSTPTCRARRARDLLALAGAVPDGGLAVAAAADGTTNALALSHDEPLRAALRARQRRALRRARAVARSSTRRTSSTTSTRSPTSTRLARAARPAHARRVLDALRLGARGVKVAVLSGGVGGARFLRGLVGVVDPADVSIIGNVGDDLEVLGLHVSPDLDSVLYTLTGLADEERGWGRADETLARARDRRRARRRVVVPARRPRHRPASRAHAAAARGRAAVARRPSGSRTRSASRRRCCRRPTIRCARSSRRPPGRSRSRRGSSRAATATRSTPCTTRARPRRVAAPGVLEALDAADVIVIAPSNPYVSIGPILAVDEIRDGARAAHASRASPSARSSAAARSRARPTGCSRGSPAARRPTHVAVCYEGLIDVLVVDETDAPAEPVRGRAQHGRHADADDRRERGAAARRCDGARGGRAGVRVAILGGTGSFGRALAARLVALGEDDVVIGSRDAERARPTADELGGGRITGATNEDAVRGADLVVLAVKADAALDTAREVAEALGETPLLSRRERDRVSQGRRRAARPRRAQPRRARAGHGRARPVAAGLHSIAAANLDAEPPDEDALDLRRRPARQGARARARGQARRRPRARRRAARERARARGPDGGDRQPEPPLQGARRHPGHRRPDRRDPDHPRARPARDPGGRRSRGADRGARRARGRRRRRRRPEGGLEGRGPGRAHRRASSRRRRPASSRATSATRARSRSILREAKRIVRERGPLVIAETRHGFICASAGVDHSNAPEPGTLVLLPARPRRERARGCASGSAS